MSLSSAASPTRRQWETAGAALIPASVLVLCRWHQDGAVLREHAQNVPGASCPGVLGYQPCVLAQCSLPACGWRREVALVRAIHLLYGPPASPGLLEEETGTSRCRLGFPVKKKGVDWVEWKQFQRSSS